MVHGVVYDIRMSMYRVLLHVAWYSVQWHNCIALIQETSHDMGVGA